MSGEGSNVSTALLAFITGAASRANFAQICESHFDQRPGDLEATRGINPPAAFTVWAEHHADGWKLRVKADAALTPEDAFKLAGEICVLGDLIEGRVEF